MGFGIDMGRSYRQPQPQPVQTTILGFGADEAKGAQAGKRELIIEHLLNGWGLKDWKPHSVIGWKQLSRISKKAHQGASGRTYDSVVVESIEASDLPTPQTIEGTFSCGLVNAYLILKELRHRLLLHQIDREKRAQRGDALSRHYRQSEAMQVSLTRFFLVWRRIENKERRINRRSFKQ